LRGPRRRNSGIWMVKRQLTLLGRSRSCHIQIAHPTISRFHAGLVRTASGVWVVDLCGPNGTFVDGRPVRFALLKEGQELQIGSIPLTVCYEFASETPSDSPSSKAAFAWIGKDIPPQSQDRAAAEPHDGQLSPLLKPDSAAEAAQFLVPGGQFDVTGDTASDRVLVALTQQFGALQQQHVRESQETLRTVVEVFGQAHSDQVELLRTACEQADALRDELQQLRQLLTEQSPDSLKNQRTDLPRIGHAAVAEDADDEVSEPASEPADSPDETHQSPVEPSDDRVSSTKTRRRWSARDDSQDEADADDSESVGDVEEHSLLQQRLLAAEKSLDQNQQLWKKLLGLATRTTD
jgi:hypothetical protein